MRLVDHPLIDGAGERWVLTQSRADVLALTQGMSDLLGRTAAEGRSPIVVSTEYARMTQPLAEALSAARGHWVVRTERDGCYDTRTGAAVDSPSDVLDLPAHPSRESVHPAFLRATIRSRLQLAVTMSTRHRVSRPVRLGGVLESIATATTGAPPGRWGALEPLLADWNREDLTERSRRRMPTESRWAAASDDPRPLVATLTVARTREGLEETTRAWVDAEDTRVHAAERGRQLLASAAAVGLPLLGVVFAALGAPDLARRPTASPPPEPLALLVGPPGVRALGVDAARWTAEVGGATVGSPRLPGVLIPLGSPDGGGWQRLDEVLQPLDRERVWRMLGLAPFLVAALTDRERRR